MLERGCVLVYNYNYKNERVEEILKHCEVTRKKCLELDVKEGYKGCGNDRTVDASYSSENYHNEDLDRVVVVKVCALYTVVAVAEENARNACEE